MMFEECALYYFSKQCPFIHSTDIECLLCLVHGWDTVVNKTTPCPTRIISGNGTEENPWPSLESREEILLPKKWVDRSLQGYLLFADTCWMFRPQQFPPLLFITKY